MGSFLAININILYGLLNRKEDKMPLNKNSITVKSKAIYQSGFFHNQNTEYYITDDKGVNYRIKDENKNTWDLMEVNKTYDIWGSIKKINKPPQIPNFMFDKGDTTFTLQIDSFKLSEVDKTIQEIEIDLSDRQKAGDSLPVVDKKSGKASYQEKIKKEQLKSYGFNKLLK